MRARHIARLLLIVGSGCAVLAGLPPARAEHAPPSTLVNRPLPAARTRPRDTPSDVNPADHRGHVLLLEFFATWCDNCTRLEPTLRELHDRYGADGLRILALSTEARSILQRRQQARPVPWRVGQTTGRTALAYRARMLPTFFVVDEEGIIRHVYTGGGARTARGLRRAVSRMMGD